MSPPWHSAPLLLAAGLAALSGCRSDRAPATSWRLEPTGDTVLTPYGDIAEAAWLDDRRWVVVAPQDRAVGIADFSHRALSRFEGTDVRELEQPFDLFRSGDSIYIDDWQRRRVTHWALAGRLGGASPALETLRGALPRARDAAGRWYFELRPPPGRDGRGNLDSGAVVRTGPDFTAPDTIAHLAPFDMVEIVSDGRQRMERRLLSGQDRWGILPDGTLWLARVSPNRVDWRDTTGRMTRGPDLPDRVLPVTQNDRDVFLNHFDAGLRPTVEQIPFAAIKPAFENALTGEGGRVWLVRSRAIGDSIRYNQVIDRRGALVAEVSHPGLGRILALGGGYALVGEQFAAGVRLLLFRMPPDTGAQAAP
jgi:hypothetical protein